MAILCKTKQAPGETISGESTPHNSKDKKKSKKKHENGQNRLIKLLKGGGDLASVFQHKNHPHEKKKKKGTRSHFMSSGRRRKGKLLSTIEKGKGGGFPIKRRAPHLLVFPNGKKQKGKGI